MSSWKVPCAYSTAPFEIAVRACLGAAQAQEGISSSVRGRAGLQMTARGRFGSARALEMVARAEALALIARAGLGTAGAPKITVVVLAGAFPKALEAFLEHLQVNIHNKNMNWNNLSVIVPPRRSGQTPDREMHLRVGCRQTTDPRMHLRIRPRKTPTCIKKGEGVV